ncbi:hypothetical protein ERJ75_000757000 [Trypanosoma vivax]|uniref:EF-hand domain-containing protein n=1 Tax=Trypanosoma vivax (strain Y486) TaxID=1055687 RepID=G0U000_TRYVY|nr:hypothetical protein TRVL_01122 [Trypanosoma vivax]KAH8614171.1 hypothetical protein ERJ75_000757000 [Trypanosoma vivax]CCC49396.1 conserved hypothetical protein [Trypanosoma vivax Y486]
MVLTAIRVLVCGADSGIVEQALSGTVENTHYAWNRRYEVVCTPVPGVGSVDGRLLSTCHLVVLTRGATPPPSIESYANVPVVSIEGAPDVVVNPLRNCNCYYGTYAAEDLKSAAVQIGLSPIHVIWDDESHTLTRTGDLVLRRAFWLIDKDGDGVLNEEELLAWQRSVSSPSFSRAELEDLFRSVSLHTATVPLSLDTFLTVHRCYLLDGDSRSVWATLHITGLHPNGLPYSWQDINAIRVSRESNTYLSHNAIQFFRNLFKLRRFQDMDDVWGVTPGCPWQHVSGFAKKRIPLDRFIEYWKYMALVKRETVVQYARYWGYKADASLLFQLRRARPFRDPGETVPNMIQVLVLGSKGCGRRSLMFTLTASDDELYDDQAQTDDKYVRTTTFFVRKGMDEIPQTVVYVTVPIDRALEVLGNDAQEKQIDVVLLCYDGGRMAESVPPIIETFLRARGSPWRCKNLPFIVVMNKAEFSQETESECEEAKQMMQQFCKDNRLLWPPVATSVETPEETEIATLNEYMYAVAKEPEIAVASAPITPGRILKRIAIVTVLTMMMGSAVRFMIRKVCAISRRKQ